MSGAVDGPWAWGVLGGAVPSAGRKWPVSQRGRGAGGREPGRPRGGTGAGRGTTAAGGSRELGPVPGTEPASAVPLHRLSPIHPLSGLGASRGEGDPGGGATTAAAVQTVWERGELQGCVSGVQLGDLL